MRKFQEPDNGENFFAIHRPEFLTLLPNILTPRKWRKAHSQEKLREKRHYAFRLN